MAKRRKRFPLLVVVLAVAWIAIMLFVPLDEQDTGESESATTIADLELPAYDSDAQIISHTGYTLKYDEQYEQADWVAYELTRAELYGTEERTDNFRADPAVSTGSATLDDYRKSGYDRGHLIPAADQKWSVEAMGDSFFLSNMSPQEPGFNRGIWSELEATVRTFADTNGTVYVVTGPVLTDGPYETIGEEHVAVPKRYYKVVLDYREPELKAIGFILPNESSSEPLETFATSVDTVERITGIDFFPRLPDEQEANLEGSYDTLLWHFSRFSATSSAGQPVRSSNDKDLMDVLREIKQESLDFLASLGIGGRTSLATT